jgi:hypothetical protein
MSKSSYRDLLILTIMIVLFGAIYMAATWSQSRPWCVGRDKEICKMLTHLKSHLTSSSQGDYSNNDSMSVTWGIQENSYQFTYLINKDEVMRVIGTEDMMYVRDYADNRWWKQPVKLVEQYNIQLPFEPQPYTQHILEVLLDKNTTYTATQAKTCSARNCVQYQVINKNAGLEMIISIDREENVLKAIEVKKGGVTEMVTVQFEQLDLIEVPKTDIKIASSNQNIFLDMVYQLEPQKERVPTYVDLIEKQREQAEQNGEVQGAPKYIAPEPTTSL